MRVATQERLTQRANKRCVSHTHNAPTPQLKKTDHLFIGKSSVTSGWLLLVRRRVGWTVVVAGTVEDLPSFSYFSMATTICVN